MIIKINRNGKIDQKLWNDGYSVSLIKKILGFYILGYFKLETAIFK